MAQENPIPPPASPGKNPEEIREANDATLRKILERELSKTQALKERGGNMGGEGKPLVHTEDPDQRAPETAVGIALQKALKAEKRRRRERGESVANPDNPNTLGDSKRELKGKFASVAESKNLENSLGVWENEGGRVRETSQEVAPPTESKAVQNLQEEKQRLVLKGKDRRTPEENARLAEIRRLERKQEVPGSGLKKPAAAKTEIAPNENAVVIRPAGKWEENRLATIERVIKRLEKKGEKMSLRGRRDLEKLNEDRGRLLSGWGENDFKMQALREKFRRTRNPVVKERLKAELQALTDSKFSPEQLAEYKKKKNAAELAARSAPTAPVIDKDLERENELRTNPVLSPEDMKFLRKRGWRNKDFAVHRKAFEKDEKEKGSKRSRVVAPPPDILKVGKEIKPDQNEFLEWAGVGESKKEDEQDRFLKWAGMDGEAGQASKPEEKEWRWSPEELEASEKAKEQSRDKRGADIYETKALNEIFKKKHPEIFDEERNKKKIASVYEKGERGAKEIRSMSPAEIERINQRNREVGAKALGEEAPERKLYQLIEQLPPSDRAAAEKAAGVLKEQGEKIEKGAEKKGLLNFIRSTGEWFRSKDPKTRLAIGLSLAALTLGAGAVSAGAFIPILGTAAVGWRFLGGAGMFAGTEAYLLKREAEKKGLEMKDISARRKAVLTAEALAFSAVTGALLGQAAHNIFSGELTEAVKNIFGVKGSEVAELAKAKPGAGVMPPPAEKLPLGEYKVGKGDNLYKIIKAKFPEISALPGGR